MKRWLPPLATVGALGLAAFILYFSLMAKADDPAPVHIAGIVRVFPPPGTADFRRQDAFGAELEFGWEGRLEVDRRVIPDDQLDRIPGINRLSFTPGPGKDIERLDGGRHCVDLYYWQTALGPDSVGPPRSWCFTAS
ncbi:MAG: hypothetical protein QOF60_2116 [Actinomycetota bacterium]|jgi:hypothetical protein|nr:hypothetical protein [Actinomycetota bacterium]